MTTATETIATAAGGIDVKRYGRMLTRVAPKLIETEAENDAALAVVAQLLEKGEENLTQEEDALVELLACLIERFEEKAYPIPDAEPKDVLADLMEHRGIKAIDLAPILGSRAKASEILAGKRGISKEQARRLGEYFHISPAAFI